MTAKRYIKSNLSSLEKKFNSSRSIRESTLYSKLAIIELCGWLEEALDDLVIRCLKKSIKDAALREQIKVNTIDRNYGFEYDKHFKNMLVQIVGYGGVEKFEKQVDNAKLLQFKSICGTLKVARHSAAHTHTRGVTHTFNAPSITINNFTRLCECIMAFEKALKKAKLV
jgi:hypothetical protein